jgi:hypothetical protein
VALSQNRYSSSMTPCLFQRPRVAIAAWPAALRRSHGRDRRDQKSSCKAGAKCKRQYATLLCHDLFPFVDCKARRSGQPPEGTEGVHCRGEQRSLIDFDSSLAHQLSARELLNSTLAVPSAINAPTI